MNLPYHKTTRTQRRKNSTWIFGNQN